VRANIVPRAQHCVSLHLHEADLVADSHRSRCGASWTPLHEAEQVLPKPTGVRQYATPQRQVEPTNGVLLLDVRHTMLEIRAAHPGFVVFDTTEQEPIMRFDSKDEATELVAELVIAESCAQLQAWKPPTTRR